MYTSHLPKGFNTRANIPMMGPEVRDPATSSKVPLAKSFQLETFLGQTNAHSQLPPAPESKGKLGMQLALRPLQRSVLGCKSTTPETHQCQHE